MTKTSKQTTDLPNEFQGLARALVQLRVSTSHIQAKRSGRSEQDSKSAATALEAIVSGIEAHPPALQCALSQATINRRQACLMYAQQISEDVAKVLKALPAGCKISPQSGWLYIRPLLRLLLWLLPEHLPMSSYPDAPAAPQGSPSQQHQAEKQQGKPGQEAVGPAAGGNWTNDFGLSFVQAVATPALVTACMEAIAFRSFPNLTLTDLPADSSGAQLLEESLAWMTVLNRFWVLATETGASQPSSLPSPSRPSPSSQPAAAHPLGPQTLPSCMHSALTEHVLLLSMLARHVFFWLQGIFKSNLRDAAAGGESWQLRQVQAGTAASKHAAFAHFFKPSTQMANAVGMWFRPPVLIAQQLVRMLTVGSMTGLLRFTDRSQVQACHLLCNFHHITLALLLPCSRREFLFLSNTASTSQVPELSTQELFTAIETHLHGLTLMFRTVLDSPDSDQTKASWAAAATSVFVAATALWHNHVQQAALDQSEGSIEARCFMPSGLTPAPGQDSLGIQAAFAKCDAALRGSHQQQQQQQQQHQQGGQRQQQQQEQEAWERAAYACAEAADLLLDLNFLRGYGLLPDEQTHIEGDKHARSWALCLYALSVLHDPENRKGEERSNAVISRVLLEQMLPVLQHVASLEASTPAVTPVVSSGKEAAAGAAPGHGARCTTCEASAIGKETDATPGAQVPVSRIICNIPADNTLLLLKAVAYVTGRAAAFVTGHECESAGTAQGLHHAGSSEASQHCSENFAEKDVDALITALDAVLRLASALVSGGPWWQEARTKHPLVLIETLYDLRAGLGRLVMASLASPSPTSDCLFSHITGLASQHSIPCTQVQEGTAGASTVCAGGCPAAATTAVLHNTGASSGVGGAVYSGDRTSVPTSWNLTDLIVRVMMSLWDVVSDEEVVGESDRPAAWLLSTWAYMYGSLQTCRLLLNGLDLAVVIFIENLRAAPLATQPTPQSNAGRGQSGAPDHSGDTSAAAGSSSCSTVTSTSASGSSVAFGAGSTYAAGSLAGSKRSVERALRLAALTPRTRWEEVLSQAMVSSGRDNATFMAGVYSLRFQLVSIPLLRRICMLALVGLLTKRQKQGVVALLGGVPCEPGSSSINTSPTRSSITREPGTSSSSTMTTTIATTSSASSTTMTTLSSVSGEGVNVGSSLLTAEPACLSQLRQEHGISLAELALAMLWLNPLNDPNDYSSSPPITSLLNHLQLALGSDQLPLITHAQRAVPALKGPITGLTGEEVGLRPVVCELWETTSLQDIYMSWVQESLLGIIDEVLSQNSWGSA